MTSTLHKLKNPIAARSSPTPQENGLAHILAYLQARTIAGLYVHIPFCFHKCHYCDFFTVVTSTGTSGRAGKSVALDHLDNPHKLFVDRLLGELEFRIHQRRPNPQTLFVGGGTPTLLHPSHWRELLKGLARLGLVDRVCEFTVEANPETVTPELAGVLADGGVGRMSIGAQSFDRRLLEVLGRWHEPKNVARAARHARDAGIGNINLDLIFAIPGQTMAALEGDIDDALRLNPDHLSCYNLTYEPDTALTQLVKIGRVHPSENDLERRMYEYLIERLDREGFVHYEVSNWARPGRKCAHNLMYWTNRNWLGVGPGAASHVDGHRWKNLPNFQKYLADGPEPTTTDHEHLPTARAIGEAMMLRIRIRSGVPLSWLDAHLPPADDRWQRIDHMVTIGLLERNTTHLRLTGPGLMVADSVVAEIL